MEAAQELALLAQGASPEVLTAALLHFVGGYTLEEVGEKLGVSGKTVRRMLERLRERARRRGAPLGGWRGEAGAVQSAGCDSRPAVSAPSRHCAGAGAHSRTPTLASLNWAVKD